MRLADYVAYWNEHPISSENNMTPNQIYYITMHPPDYNLSISDEEIQDLQFYCNAVTDLNSIDSEDLCDPSPSNALTTLQHYSDYFDRYQLSNSYDYDLYQN